jgi:hypothetical protein
VDAATATGQLAGDEAGAHPGGVLPKGSERGPLSPRGSKSLQNHASGLASVHADKAVRAPFGFGQRALKMRHVALRRCAALASAVQKSLRWPDAKGKGQRG